MRRMTTVDSSISEPRPILFIRRRPSPRALAVAKQVERILFVVFALLVLGCVAKQSVRERLQRTGQAFCGLR
jgi:hypothetical protein